MEHPAVLTESFKKSPATSVAGGGGGGGENHKNHERQDQYIKLAPTSIPDYNRFDGKVKGKFQALSKAKSDLVPIYRGHIGMANE